MRCSKPLSDPSSVERGYGPVCWAKLRKDYLDCIPYEKRTIADSELALNTYSKLVSRLLNGERKECWCGEPFENGSLMSYDHEGGLPLKGFGAPQWVFWHCPNCGYDTSWWKVRPGDLSDLTTVDKEKEGDNGKATKP